MQNYYESERCDCEAIHEETVAEVMAKMPDEKSLMELADMFKLFSDSTRVRILCALQYSELCVCDIAYALGMTKSAISHQLRQLRQTRLVKSRREGKVVYYSLDDHHVVKIFEQGMLHINE